VAALAAYVSADAPAHGDAAERHLVHRLQGPLPARQRFDLLPAYDHRLAVDAMEAIRTEDARAICEELFRERGMPHKRYAVASAVFPEIILDWSEEPTRGRCGGSRAALRDPCLVDTRG
jgi:hypothetical protein